MSELIVVIDLSFANLAFISSLIIDWDKIERPKVKTTIKNSIAKYKLSVGNSNHFANHNDFAKHNFVPSNSIKSFAIHILNNSFVIRF